MWTILIVIAIYFILEYLSKNGYFLSGKISRYYRKVKDILSAYTSSEFGKQLIIRAKFELANFYQNYQRTLKNTPNLLTDYQKDVISNGDYKDYKGDDYDICQMWAFLFIKDNMRDFGPMSHVGINEEQAFSDFREYIDKKVNEIVLNKNCPKSFKTFFNVIKNQHKGEK